MAKCTFCRKKFGFTDNRYKFPTIHAEFCFDCMACSVCDSKATGEWRGVVGWQAFCKDHYNQHSGFLQNTPKQWPDEHIEARLRFLKRVIERDNKLLIEISSKGSGKLNLFGETAAILGGNYDAATYWKLSSMNAGMQLNSAQQQLNAEIEECQKQIAELEKLRQKENAVSEASFGGVTLEPESQDPLQILKVRFAKGEITKEQCDEMSKILKS